MIRERRKPQRDGVPDRTLRHTMRLKKRGKGVVAVPADELPKLTAEQVRNTLESVRRQTLPSEAPSNVAEAIRRRFRSLGGAELRLPVRNAMRKPPKLK